MSECKLEDDAFHKSQSKKMLLSKFSRKFSNKKLLKSDQNNNAYNSASNENEEPRNARLQKFLSKGISLGYDHMRVLNALEKANENMSMSQFLEILIRSEDSVSSDETFCDVNQNETLLKGLDKGNLLCIDAVDIALAYSHGTCLSIEGVQACMNCLHELGFTNTLIYVTVMNRIAGNLSYNDRFKFRDKQKHASRFNGSAEKRWTNFLKYSASQKAIFISNAFCKQTSASLEAVFRKFYPDARIITYRFDGEIFEIVGLITHQAICKRSQYQCPYGKNCTYGNKCKYFHPERGSEPRLSITDMLVKKAGIERERLQKMVMKNKGLKLANQDVSSMLSDIEKDMLSKAGDSEHSENIGRFCVRHVDTSSEMRENIENSQHRIQEKKHRLRKARKNEVTDQSDSYFTWTAGTNPRNSFHEISRGGSLEGLSHENRKFGSCFLNCHFSDPLPSLWFPHSLSDAFSRNDDNIRGFDNSDDCYSPDFLPFAQKCVMNESLIYNDKDHIKSIPQEETEVGSNHRITSEHRTLSNTAFCIPFDPHESKAIAYPLDSGDDSANNNDHLTEKNYPDRWSKVNQSTECWSGNDKYMSENWPKILLGQIHEADEDVCCGNYSIM